MTVRSTFVLPLVVSKSLTFQLRSPSPFSAGSLFILTSVGKTAVLNCLQSTSTICHSLTKREKINALLLCTQNVKLSAGWLNVSRVLGFINLCVNPLIYAARYEVFKLTLKKMLKKDNTIASATPMTAWFDCTGCINKKLCSAKWTARPSCLVGLLDKMR